MRHFPPERTHRLATRGYNRRVPHQVGHSLTLLAVAAAALLPSPRVPGSKARATATERPIHDRLATHIKALRGSMGVAAIDLRTGEQIAVDADRRFPTASLIKVPVMVEAYHRSPRASSAATR